MKNLLNVKGAKALTKNEQKSINGGCPTIVNWDADDVAECAQTGGTWTCVGSNTCGCVIDAPKPTIGIK